jgi:1L-myo-inositol 1-phosphate cytidylyltransferase / CDP-L-myo-inositol myo-inositolphosphotransferase
MQTVLPILIADAPDALTELCGVNLLERLLRILQRLGFRRAIVFSSTPETIGAELERHSSAREEITADLVPGAIKPLTAQLILQHGGPSRLLMAPANVYCDSRLLAALCASDSPAALIDSNPPHFAQHLIRNPCGPALVTRELLSACSSSALFLDELKIKIGNGMISTLDAATVDDYIGSMRRHVRPFCFRAPPAQDRRLAERIILDSAQNGTLDFPAYVHAPIETAIVSRLCRTRITPNQITIVGLIIGCGATAAFVVGRVGLGLLAALIFGVVDGLDGKLARVKIETTRRGEWEHHVDTFVENSWWTAIAFHLWQAGQLPSAFYFLALLVVSHVLDGFGKRRAHRATGRRLDDVAPFDRAFRLIGARRNVYIWALTVGFLLNALPQTYISICGWATVTAGVHFLRSVWICNASRRRLILTGRVL